MCIYIHNIGICIYINTYPYIHMYNIYLCVYICIYWGRGTGLEATTGAQHGWASLAGRPASQHALFGLRHRFGELRHRRVGMWVWWEAAAGNAGVTRVICTMVEQ